jgi:hypothetical protein
VANVRIDGNELHIDLSLVDALLAFHGSFRIPLAHVKNAYVSNLEELELRSRLAGVGLGYLKEAGIFTDPSGVLFCDVTGDRDFLVIDTRGERFPRIAVSLPPDRDPNALAHEIMRSPGTGPVES